MTYPESPEERRTFASRTPSNDNPDKVVYRRGFVTRHQVSGWRFTVRRIASGIALHDTRMLVDPLRTQTRAVLIGALALVTALAGCFVFSLIRPNGSAANNPVLADQATAALYVRVGDELHPVLNLTSARLIAGRPVNPTQVRSTELDKFPRGNLIGIPGAPERLVQSADRDANWTVCDAAGGPAAGVTVIAGVPDSTGSRAAVLGAGRAVLVSSANSTWLLWDGRRSRVDLADHAVTGALGLGTDVPAPRPIAVGLFNAIPEAPPLSAPAIAEAGSLPRYGLPAPAPIGAVVESYALQGGSAGGVIYYAVLPDGLQPISPVLAAVLRNSNSYGLDQPPRLSADQVARAPVSRALDAGRYPDQRVSLVDAVHDPVTCAYWSKAAGASTNSLTLLSGSALPIPERLHTEDLVAAGTEGTARRVAITPGAGYFAQAVGQNSVSPTGGSLFWIADTGVRYGIDNEATGSGAGPAKTAEVLGLKPPPTPIPWSILSLYAPGPTLSRDDALLAHDGLAPDSRPGRISAEGQN
ncbi:type VII secretion protein EccB [Mycobacterium shigaense]|uniref:ESX-3 secretion system ATPase EccB3 n=1 Tax=Mycobacterium shigaense TaxID=722731 RepID=A0A1Z4EHP9_9MYCO|nr:type VII secretion protein EccB [Mycobacterium shigaense]MEA1124678.1 type VII secretion protein EccB [Mycobacterium shigaense]PRI14154.1 type VII secretion protein EccB [Mycobacterium shigaense]BAX92493.1 ESX-3 secretion system ATPase EccB3 [Mycobacterium shigaense]